MSFRDSVKADNARVFGNTMEFADLRTVVYDGATYEAVPCVISKLKEKDRHQNMTDHAQGIYFVTAVFHCPVEALGGNVPEKGCRIAIDDDSGFLHEYYVAQSGCDLNMVRLELEAYDE